MPGPLARAVAVLATLMAGCASLPPPDGRTPATALADTSETRLGRAVAAAVTANPGKTGVHPLSEARDAFAARVLLAASAQKTLDAQYYIWHGDQVGHLLFEALWQAAGRGVRVRLLLDDLNTRGLDPVIAALDSHPDIEVRRYNPFTQRGSRALGFLTDFSRLNRRMHNKSFTVDNQATVVGGRNVGNEYYGVGSGTVFADLDVLAVGAAVRGLSRQFDLYWKSPSACPSASLVGASGPEGAATLEAAFASARADPESVAYIEAARTTPLVRALLAGSLDMEWTRARLVHDDPAKTLDLVSPCFIPGDQGTAALVALAGRGVKVRVLTNSLSSSEVTIVHAGYAKRRLDLLRAGVRLFELKATAGKKPQEEHSGLGSSSSAALHAKAFAVDRSRIFVGSFNFDPRYGTARGRVRGEVAARRQWPGADRAHGIGRDAARDGAGSRLAAAPGPGVPFAAAGRLDALARRVVTKFVPMVRPRRAGFTWGQPAPERTGNRGFGID